MLGLLSEKLQGKLGGFPFHFGTVEDTETAVEFLQQTTATPY
jgi:hypothetical protein